MYEIAEEVATLVKGRLFFHHRGAGNGISAARLGRVLELSERKIRKAVEALREEGEPIGAHPKCGYFWPADQEEFDHFCDFLEKRSMKTLRLLSQMRRISLPALMGQLQLQFTEAGEPELREE